ncbi:MAG: transcription-repair coupling factor [Bacteroidaceae bacterium]|nr:transcription-repair coupling factor [Bacteroidaceae bacterium]
MRIEELTQLYARHKGVEAFQKVWESGAKTVFLQGLVSSAVPVLAAACRRTSLAPRTGVVIAVLNDAEEAGYFYHDLTGLLGGQDDKQTAGEVLFFPSSYKRAIKYGQRDDAAEVLRTEVLTGLSSSRGNGENIIVVTYPDALAEGVASQDNLARNTLTLHVEQHIDISVLAEQLGEAGFHRTDYVYEPGQYAVRGSIIDVFSFSSEYPYRIDFFGDDIDSIRIFEVESQLSRERVDEVFITPEKSSAGEASLLDYLPEGSTLLFHDFLWVCERIEAIGKQEPYEPNSPGSPSIISKSDFMRKCAELRRVEFGSRPTGTPEAVIRFDFSPQPLFHKNFDFVASTLTDYIGKGYKLYILSDSSKQTDRLRTIFEERGDDIPFTPIDHTLHEGFADHTLHACFFTDHQIFGRFHKYSLRSDKARQGKVSVALKELAQFELGDYVVHIDHGIGRFAGLVRVPNGDTTQEAIKLLYEGKNGSQDVLLVSIHALHKISKYKGKDGEAPRVSHLGTGAWEKMKQRTKAKIKDIARDLIILYSKRLKEQGFAYSPDSFMQHELEASFIYEDTPDQLKATQDVKADMERPRPMDRLICGDVGFGKTEVAIRAAFKACADNKQVAVLVPTTVLAYQHYQTFTERLRDYPVKVEYLSRARTPADEKRILAELADGRVNILIGTHKLIGKNVRFKDLGLLIIDEEQKFGVSVKERLKQLKVNVDTLTLTATPIPRTLQFSLMGARDLSIIQTPPPNRYPIQTEVHPFNEDIIRDAINFEMARGGQTFFINNRVQNLPELASLVTRLVPDARVAIGHGQMDPESLEHVILGFINYDYDVLICTSIMENGIDIPNANTILINQAHMFGLSDLHQMRGRVGRTNRRAFCYLLAPPLSTISDEARRRLTAIENFTDLGSGIHIAMQDLDIRGAGNLLGAEQSGFIADLGYETYQRILNEAVHELRTEEFADLMAEKNAEPDAASDDWSYVNECTFDSDLELLFPDEYITGSSERILIYRELDSLETDDQLAAFQSRLEDRFGPIPDEGQELLHVVPLRRIAKNLGIEKIVLKAGRMVLYFVSDTESPYYQSDTFGRVLRYPALSSHECQFRESGGRQNLLIADVHSVREALEVLKAI